MKPGEHAEDWHTDGGASVIHAALTIFGHRMVEVESWDPDEEITTQLHQRPLSLYVGNFSARLETKLRIRLRSRPRLRQW